MYDTNTTILTPKIIFCAAGNDVVFGDANIQPILPRLKVRLEPILKITFKVGDIKSVLVELKDVSQNVPGISNGVFLRGQLFKRELEEGEVDYLEVITE